MRWGSNTPSSGVTSSFSLSWVKARHSLDIRGYVATPQHWGGAVRFSRPFNTPYYLCGATEFLASIHNTWSPPIRVQFPRSFGCPAEHRRVLPVSDLWEDPCIRKTRERHNYGAYADGFAFECSSLGSQSCPDRWTLFTGGWRRI
jgi:hypothetical protein